ncbi:Na-translocating system protein MpsC family protein [Jeotgalibacillus campisalis]|uniref:Na+-translocating membrane potential-generating system MpsC domain-containing protein n=1 Tax=Jeotgalibacillus campisalis TaxID=220754 RepID=A0A0C2SB12_9BACL|nr:Na-translocating system protein MpsC family protein [Jeotgalibacillus campisalis]KIL51134.1 hypothetical protein KR50_10150 [Jeotgalibacillus campisalis]
MSDLSQSSISFFIDEFFEKHFGEKPGKLSVISHSQSIVIHLEDFLLASEKILFKQGNSKQVLETRDFMIFTLKSEILQELEKITDLHFSELYADWNLEKGSGMLLAVTDSSQKADPLPWPSDVDEETVREIFLINSIYTEKKPDSIHYYWLNDQYLLIERSGILVDIEKELIKNGSEEQLRLAKRPMEHRIFKLFNIVGSLNRAVIELFADWDFHKDKGYHVLVLKQIE